MLAAHHSTVRVADGGVPSTSPAASCPMLRKSCAPTSRHAAAAVGNASAVSRLLAVGASPALRTATGADVVKIACDARQTEVVGVLRRHAAGVAGGRRKPRPRTWHRWPGWPGCRE